VAKKAKNKVVEPTLGELVEQSDLSVDIQVSDVKNATKQIVDFFNRGQKIMDVKGGKMALLNKLSEILPFSPPVIDPLLGAKKALVDLYDELRSKEMSLQSKLNEIPEVVEINKNLKVIDYKKKVLSQRVEVIDDYCLRQLSIMDASNTKKIESPLKATLKYRPNPYKLVLDESKMDKLPEDCVTRTVEVTEELANKMIELGLITKKDIQYSCSKEQQKMLIERLSDEKKKIDDWDSSTEDERVDKGLKKPLKKDMIVGASITRTVGLAGDFNNFKLK